MEEDYDWIIKCWTCDTEIKVTTDVNGECPNCHLKYTWDFDCDYEDDAVYIPIFEEIK